MDPAVQWAQAFGGIVGAGIPHCLPDTNAAVPRHQGDQSMGIMRRVAMCGAGALIFPNPVMIGPAFRVCDCDHGGAAVLAFEQPLEELLSVGW